MLKLEIVTPEQRVFDDTVDSVTIPTISGNVGVLTNHAPMISALGSGLLSYTKGGASERILISGGFVEVSGNKVAVLADLAERAEDIDPATARVELDAASKAVGSWSGTAADFEAEKDRLDRAQARVQLASGK